MICMLVKVLYVYVWVVLDERMQYVYVNACAWECTRVFVLLCTSTYTRNVRMFVGSMFVTTRDTCVSAIIQCLVCHA